MTDTSTRTLSSPTSNAEQAVRTGIVDSVVAHLADAHASWGTSQLDDTLPGAVRHLIRAVKALTGEVRVLRYASEGAR